MTNATRVGVLIDSLHGYQAAIANGFFGFMNSQDVSVMTFALYPRGLHNLNLKAEIDYEVINPLQLDGVFVFLAQLSQFVTEQELANQMNRFRNLPMVSLARSINNTPFVKVDNRIGMNQLMDHLIFKRGFRRFVFMQGFVQDFDSHLRLAIFREKLYLNNIFFREDFLLDGDYSIPASLKAMTLFLQTTRQFDVVVCANDKMAFGVIAALREVGIQVPKDVAVVGFDDIEDSDEITIPMTTVRQPLAELGASAAKNLLQQIRKQPFEAIITLPTELVIRQSCGELTTIVPQLKNIQTDVFTNFLQNVKQAIPPEIQFPSDWGTELFNYFYSTLEDDRDFLAFWRDWIQWSTTKTHDLLWWQLIIFSFQPILLDLKDLTQVQHFSLTLAKSQVILSEISQLTWLKKQGQTKAIIIQLDTLETQLMSAISITDFVKSLGFHLKNLQIKQCFIVLYSNSIRNPDQQAEVILAFSHAQQIEIDHSTFLANLLLPKSMHKHLNHNLIFYPLFVADSLYGYLLIEPSNTNYEVLEKLRQSISYGLHNVKHIQQLEISHEGAIRAIGLALEARDAETAGHTDRVTELALEIGQKIQLNKLQLQHLRWGAYLHDIGKMVLPDAILHKPDRLTPEEHIVMREHVLRGQSFAEQLPFLPQEVSRIIRQHHERWDGTGYPDGISGEQIDLGARVFAICDVFDALCSERPYKPAFSLEKAVAEIRKSAETGHLDPTLVQVFLTRVLPSYTPSKAHLSLLAKF